MSILNNIYNNDEYMDLVFDIIDNKDFNKLKNNKHHGLTRFEHSVKVSYISYRIAKILRLNCKETARAGLLHDFFDNDDLKGKQLKFRFFYHPYKSLENADSKFYLSDMERDIIVSHMFPVIPHKIPKYMESWVVSGVDKVVAIYELVYSYGKILSYKFANLYLLLVLIGRYIGI